MFKSVGSLFAAKNKGGSKGGSTQVPAPSTSAPVNAGQPAVDMTVLTAVVAAYNSVPTSFIYTSTAQHTPLVAAGLVEVNPGMADESGSFATRPTQAGIDLVIANTPAGANTATETATAPAGDKSKYTVVSGVPVPEAKRGGRSGTLYPFGTLEVGQSFFVAATDAKPNPAKSLASTISSAQARFAVQQGTKQVAAKDAEGNAIAGQMVTVPNMVATRVFVARSVADGAPWGSSGVKGAGVFRTK